MDFQFLVIAVFLGVFFAMKAFAVALSPKSGWSFLFRAPVFAPFTERRGLRKNPASVKRLKERFLFLACANVIAVELYQYIFSAFEFGHAAQAWLFAPYIYLFTNLMGTSAQCLGLLTKEIPADIHNFPYLAKSVSEFWGKRWNIWVGDWLAVISKRFVPRPGPFRLFVAFALSGLFHELIIAAPFYLHSGRNYFGLMSAFFMLQFFFTLADKKLFSNAPDVVRRAFLWIALLGPMPLFINPSVLSFFGF